MPYSWLHYNLVKNVSKEKTFHACQIPQDISELFIQSSTQEGDVVFVLFGGSGSEIEVAKNLKRKYLTCEMNADYCDIIHIRLETGGIQMEHRLEAMKEKQ